eukprot:6009606-Pyramimonas_sp.AAC.1
MLIGSECEGYLVLIDLFIIREEREIENYTWPWGYRPTSPATAATADSASLRPDRLPRAQRLLS